MARHSRDGCGKMWKEVKKRKLASSNALSHSPSLAGECFTHHEVIGSDIIGNDESVIGELDCELGAGD